MQQMVREYQKKLVGAQTELAAAYHHVQDADTQQAESRARSEELQLRLSSARDEAQAILKAQQGVQHPALSNLGGAEAEQPERKPSQVCHDL